MSQTLSEAEKSFQEFEWRNSEWKLYLENLYPPPPLSKIEYYKRKWFKNNINSALALESNQGKRDGTYAKHPNAQSTTTKTSYIPSIYTATPPLLLFIGLIFSAVYTLPFVSRRVLRFALAFYISGFVFSMFSRFGKIQWNTHYWQTCIADHSFQALLITTATLILQSWISLISPTLSAIVLLGETSSQWMTLIPRSLAAHVSVVAATRKINTNRYRLLEFQADVEIFVGFFILILLFMRYTSGITVLLYFNALRFKYQLSPLTQAAFQKIHQKIIFFLSKPSIPSFVLSSYKMACSFLNNYNAH